jgi:hypothetical protein
MMSQGIPTIGIVPDAQKEIRLCLSLHPGCGNAVALHFGHRTSVDFDFFVPPRSVLASRAEGDSARAGYSAGWLGFGLKNMRLRLSHNSILAPFLCMMALCWMTDSVLFQAQ